MPIDLSDDDHRHLTTMIYTILDAITGRRVSRDEAMNAIAHVITSASINEPQLRRWLKPETVAGWIDRCDGPPALPSGCLPYDPAPDFRRRVSELAKAALALNVSPLTLSGVLSSLEDDLFAMHRAELRERGEPTGI
jgi:hypothetical protein